MGGVLKIQPTPREVGERVLELLNEIDAERPKVDDELMADRLGAYLDALGVDRKPVRFHTDVRAYRLARVWPGSDRASWALFTTRQSRLLESTRTMNDRRSDVRRQLGRLLDADWTVIALGLGSSKYVRGVRTVSTSLDRIAQRLTTGMGTSSRHFAALIPLAEAAGAGLFAYSVGWNGRCIDLAALTRPKMRFDQEGRLHDWDGRLAVEWPNAKGMYFWHGVDMPEHAGRDPDAVTPTRVLGWANAERRRVAIERIGLQRFLTEVRATVVQEDDYGRLWHTSRDVGGEPFVAVEVVNGTVEPDGSYRRYFLRVPPSARTARHAVAWTFGLTTPEYEPAVES
jgi:hypothetical protein